MSAATLITDGVTGELIGAHNVTIGIYSFDVSFVDGTRAADFHGCDEAADFVFSGLLGVNALDAAIALRDQVFLDGPSGNFDSDPNAVVGCDNDPCMTLVPSGLDPDPSSTLMKSAAMINVGGAGVDLVGIATYDRSVNTAGFLSVAPGLIDILDPAGATSPQIFAVNYAGFSVVSLPASALLLMSALFGFAGVARRRKV